MGIANSVVNIENASLSSMGTEQLLDMFSKESVTIQEDLTATTHHDKTTATNTKISGHGYQRLIDNLTEIWDEKQYENEYDLDNFIKSLKN